MKIPFKKVNITVLWSDKTNLNSPREQVYMSSAYNSRNLQTSPPPPPVRKAYKKLIAVANLENCAG